MNSTSDYVSIPPRTNLKPRLIVRKPIIDPVLSPTLLQIYCIGLIGPISYSFWVWATICDLTVTILIMYIVAFYSNILIFFCHLSYSHQNISSFASPFYSLSQKPTTQHHLYPNTYPIQLPPPPPKRVTKTEN